MIKAVVFDLDDTIFMTEAIAFEIENEVLTRLGHEPMSREVHRRTWGMPIDKAIQVRATGVNLDNFSRVYHEVLEEYSHQNKLDIMSDDAVWPLEELANMGYKLLVVTSRMFIELKHILEKDHALKDHIETFYYRDILEYHKPDPRVFDKLLVDHGLVPNEVIYVGDALSDAEAANSAGLRFICTLEGGLRTKNDFNSYKVDVFIDRFADVVGAVKQLS